jgi:signal transduction histidine kinase
VNQIDAWEIANREDLFGRVSLEGFTFVANSDFHDLGHLSSWKSLIYSEKEKEAVKRAIVERKLSLFFFKENGTGRELPKLPPPMEDSPSFSTPEEIPGEKTKILIADDEKDLVEMLAYNLRKKGYQVLTAYNGCEAWERIESGKPDVIILDLMMPDLDGWELCRLVRRSQREEIKGMGVLMLTARAMPEDRVFGLELGADDYLTKPFSISELILRVGKMVQKRRTLTELQEHVVCHELEMKKKEESLRKIVHDLKSHLISMGASAKLLLGGKAAREESKFLGTIYDNSLRLTQWVDDILNSTREGSRNGDPDQKEIEIESLVKEVVDLMRDPASTKGIEISYGSFSPVPSIRGNGQLLQRAITNLIQNALKYTPRGGEVKVSVTAYFRQGEMGVVEISVKDTGIGIYQEDMERIFEPYYRGKNAGAEDGVGLGLSLVKEVVDSHGGRILVESEPQKGSTFSMMLPAGGKFN